jgi:aminoglycoside phosphotransferase (APT) family kinase protein
LPAFADLADRLLSFPTPPGRPQLVHGDLTGNVLFAPGQPAAVIDISPYWRPPSYAEAVVAADALCWHDADASIVALTDLPVEAVARALLFRMATTNELATAEPETVDVPAEALRYKRAAEVIGA